MRMMRTMPRRSLPMPPPPPPLRRPLAAHLPPVPSCPCRPKLAPCRSSTPPRPRSSRSRRRRARQSVPSAAACVGSSDAVLHAPMCPPVPSSSIRAADSSAISSSGAARTLAPSPIGSYARRTASPRTRASGIGRGRRATHGASAPTRSVRRRGRLSRTLRGRPRRRPNGRTFWLRRPRLWLA